MTKKKYYYNVIDIKKIIKDNKIIKQQMKWVIIAHKSVTLFNNLQMFKLTNRKK